MKVFMMFQMKKKSHYYAYKKNYKKKSRKCKKWFIKRFLKFRFGRHGDNAKNHLQYEMIAESYLKPKYYTPCVAGSIFGVVKSNGDVFPVRF